MKLRLFDNSLRFRLTTDEVHQLARGETVVDMVQFARSTRLLYALVPSSIKQQIDAILEEETITVSIPLEQLQHFAHSSNEGLYATQTVTNAGDTLDIHIEKDFGG